MGDDLRDGFVTLTGFAPLSWQDRFLREHLVRGDLPAAVDVPTGLGKTAVMALWLIARANGAPLPRRLLYVVDRRAVVDQATEFAEQLRARLDQPAADGMKGLLGLRDRSLPISTLRGQHVDNREWLEDPAAVAIVVGTVDMVGSRLLFEGYGVSRKMRPYHAGLLGADVLVVLDEAHLVPPFEQLLESIEGDSERFGPRHALGDLAIPPFRLLSLSATGRQRQGVVFRLGDGDLGDATVAKRLAAAKVLAVESLEAESDLAEELASRAWQLAGAGSMPVRCLVFCDRREVAEQAHNALQRRIRATPAPAACELFVGARRVLERQLAAARLGALGFLAGTSAACSAAAFLVATSAAEVGVDLDADHVVCDLVSWERMVQRLGRVNRRGARDACDPARVLVLDQGPPSPKDPDRPSDAERHALAVHAARRAVLDALPSFDGATRDASPGALRNLQLRAAMEPSLRDLVARATTPAPLRPELTRALVDAWSMTALDEHTGRPEVQPWLRGWVEDPPQTAVAWRVCLPVQRGGEALPLADTNAFFEAAPPHASELLETETWRVFNWLVERAGIEAARGPAGLEEAGDAPVAPADETRVSQAELVSEPPRAANLSAPGRVVGFVLSPGSDVREVLRVDTLASLRAKSGKRERDRLAGLLAGATLVVDARLGGLADGLLNVEAEGPAHTADDGELWLDPVDGVPAVRFRVRSVRAGSGEEPAADWRERLRLEIEHTEEGEPLAWLVVEKWHADAATEDDRSVGPPQVLIEHQAWAEDRARGLAARLGLPEEYAAVLALAARLHDEGKRAERWQRAFNAPRDGEHYAKTLGPMNWRLLDGYRHEFGSLPYAEAHPALQALPPDRRDLVLHLIAAHHGKGRPLIATSGCDDAPPSALRDRARNVGLRFARLQRQWGPWGLAWWEALLRAADQQASRDNDRRRAGKEA